MHPRQGCLSEEALVQAGEVMQACYKWVLLECTALAAGCLPRSVLLLLLLLLLLLCLAVHYSVLFYSTI
jgi:hypothetical protein